MKNPEYSIVLPVCHGGRFLDSALSSLQRVNPPPGGFEVIVAGTGDEAATIFNRYARPDWVFVESRGNRSRLLNAACAAARGRFWVFSDDDCVFPAEWLVTIEHARDQNPGVSLLGGSDILAREGDDFDLALDAVLNSWMGTGGTRAARTIKAGRYYPKLWNMVVSANAARKVALDGRAIIFDPDLPVHEDVDLVDRICGKHNWAVYVPSVSVEHSRDTTFGEFARRNLAMARVCRQRGIHRTSHLAIVMAAAGIIFLAFASLAVPILWPVFVATAGLYLACALLTGLNGAVKKRRARVAFWIPALIIAMHGARAAGFLLPHRSSKERAI